MAVPTFTHALSFRHSIFSLFAAGFISVLVFHQGLATLWYLVGITPNAPFSVRPVPPFGVPQIWSVAFWAGIWGIVYGLVAGRFADGRKYWIVAFAFGAIVPTLFGRLVIAPLRGLPANWDLVALSRVMLINGVWGLGTATLLRWRR